MTAQPAQPYHGPHVVLDRDEMDLLARLLDHPDAELEATAAVQDRLRRKIDTAVASHPAWREPLR